MAKNTFLGVCFVSIVVLIVIWFLKSYLIEYFAGAAKYKPSESIKKYVAPKTLRSKAEVLKEIKSGEIKVKSSDQLKKELDDLIRKKSLEKK